MKINYITKDFDEVIDEIAEEYGTVDLDIKAQIMELVAKQMTHRAPSEATTWRYRDERLIIHYCRNSNSVEIMLTTGEILLEVKL